MYVAAFGVAVNQYYLKRITCLISFMYYYEKGFASIGVSHIVHIVDFVFSYEGYDNWA